MTAYPESEPVIFYGALRSGTTLMRLIMDAHPQIYCPGERDFMIDHLSGSGEAMTLDRDALKASRIFRQSGLTLPETANGTDALAQMLREDRAASDKPVHILILHRDIAKIRRLFPDARYVHLLRDPRDVARSSIGMGWAGNTWHGVDHWIHTEASWQQNRPSREQVHELHYEALLNDVEGTLSSLCAFLGLDYKTEMLRYSETSSYDRIDPSLAYQWRHKQTAQEVSEVEYKLGDLLQHTGYSPSDDGPKKPLAVRRVVLRLHDKAKVWQMRIQRFGLLDPVLVSVSKRLGARSLGRAAKLRIDEKAQKYLK